MLNMIASYIRVVLIALYLSLCSLTVFITNVIDRQFRFYFWFSRIVGLGVIWLSGVKLKVEIDPAIDTSKPYVYVSNHSSLFDVPVMIATVPTHASMVFKKELAKIPVFGWQLVTGPYILADRQSPDKAVKTIEQAKALMSEKNVSVILFAEGTRSKTGEVQPFKRGAFYLAARVNYPIVPVAICGAEKILTKGKMRLNPGTITIKFTAPIETEMINNKQDELNLMEKVRQIIINNRKEN
jgi:1-acyl-sn-glycerol-3-phosphate acyltransferase